MASVDAYQIMLQKMHRRAQRAEGKLKRIEEWLRICEYGERKYRGDYVGCKMSQFHLREIAKEIRK